MRVVEMLGERCQIGKAESVHVAKERGLDDGRSRPVQKERCAECGEAMPEEERMNEEDARSLDDDQACRRYGPERRLRTRDDGPWP